ncbi:MAG: hypothetical protein V1661_01625 [bacterium]
MQKRSTREFRSCAHLVGLFVIAVSFILIGCGQEDVPVGSIQQAVVGEGHTWAHDDWSWRVLYEARYALSQQHHDGTSNNSFSGGYYGDWDYVGNDSFAHSRASAEAYGIVGTVGSYNGYYAGGECTYFVRLVLYRATYWNFSDHYTTPNYGTGNGMYYINGEMDSNPSNWQGGWALRGNSHYAIAEQRAYVSGSWGWWVIDSNYVNTWRIGKHFFTDSQLSSGGYYGWRPQRGSNNW